MSRIAIPSFSHNIRVFTEGAVLGAAEFCAVSAAQSSIAQVRVFTRKDPPESGHYTAPWRIHPCVPECQLTCLGFQNTKLTTIRWSGPRQKERRFTKRFSGLMTSSLDFGFPQLSHRSFRS